MCCVIKLFQVAPPGSAKLFRKAKRAIHSEFVQEVQDCLFKEKYFVRCHVRASMVAHRYKVDLAVSAISGAVLYAECHQCPASALDRCAHVSSVLLYMVQHVNTNGHSGMYIANESLPQTTSWQFFFIVLSFKN